MPDKYYFVDGTNCNYQPIVFDGVSYMPFPIIMTEAGYNGQGSIVRPKLQVSNVGGFVSNLLLQGQDLVGANIIWTRVFARFIDAENYPGGVSPYTPDTTAAYAPEIFYIFQKTKENQQLVEWELATSFELTGRKLPSRPQLANICSWRYREKGTCGYSGPPISDSNNNLFSGPPYNMPTLTDQGMWSPFIVYTRGDYVTTFSNNQALQGVPLVFVCLTTGSTGTQDSPLIINNTRWVGDNCSKTLAGCRPRFPFPAVLPFGGWPGLTVSSYVAGYSTTNT